MLFSWVNVSAQEHDQVLPAFPAGYLQRTDDLQVSCILTQVEVLNNQFPQKHAKIRSRLSVKVSKMAAAVRPCILWISLVPACNNTLTHPHIATLCTDVRALCRAGDFSIDFAFSKSADILHAYRGTSIRSGSPMHARMHANHHNRTRLYLYSRGQVQCWVWRGMRVL